MVSDGEGKRWGRRSGEGRRRSGVACSRARRGRLEGAARQRASCPEVENEVGWLIGYKWVACASLLIGPVR
jgi:hypothetical protein